MSMPQDVFLTQAGRGGKQCRLGVWVGLTYVLETRLSWIGCTPQSDSVMDYKPSLKNINLLSWQSFELCVDCVWKETWLEVLIPDL